MPPRNPPASRRLPCRFYDYRRYGEQQLRQEGGQFNECGYVAYHGTMPLEELMMEDPAEKHQREQGLQMGGLTQ